MRELIEDYTGKKSWCHIISRKTPLDGVWATNDMMVVGTCVMPAGYGVGDHHFLQLTFSYLLLWAHFHQW